jgi:hypothetical protein
MTSGSNSASIPRRRWLVVAVGLLALVVAVFSTCIVAVWKWNVFAPAFQSLDDASAAEIESLEVLAINRPDGGPDISAGGKALLPIPAEHREAVLAPLRGAPAISKPRGIYLGQIQLRFRDGRKLIVYLHRTTEDTLQFTIGSRQYEVVPLEKFLKPLAEIEAKIKSR